jgi:predicted  nucleic acid-binding Zn-ribbon protein
MTNRWARRGGAAVGVLWLVVVLVLFAAAAVFGYVQMDDRAAIGDTVKSLEREKAALQSELDAARQKLKDLATAVGYAKEGAEGASVEALRLDLEGLRAQFPAFVTSEVRTLEQAKSALVQAVQQASDLAKQSEQDRANAVAAREEADRKVAEIQGERDEKITSLDRDLQAASEHAKAAETDLRSQIQELRDRNDSLEAQSREERDSATRVEGELRREVNRRDARIDYLSQKQARLREQAAKPDGKVLQVSPDGLVVYLDLGKKDGITVGTKLEVYSEAASGVRVPKGFCQVRSVQADYAEALLSETTALRPVVKDDFVSSPIFQRGEKYHFALLGRFTGRYTRSEIVGLLREASHTVDDTVGTATDFLVLGEPEVSEDGSTPQDLLATPEFRNAQTLGVEVLRQSELYRFLR